jgi:hypothetical protein
VVRDRVVEADPIRREAGALKATDQSECVLFIAHPGHELLVYSLFAQRRMNVLVLTDGSGGSGEPRIHKTRELVPRLRRQTTGTSRVVARLARRERTD